MLSTHYTLKEKRDRLDVLIDTSRGKKNIGYIKNNIYYKIVKGSKHLFKVLDAWGIDSGLLNDYLLPNNSKIIVYDKEDGMFYETDAQNFSLNAVYYHFKNTAEDYGTQLFLPRKFWNQRSVKDCFKNYFNDNINQEV